MGQVQVFTSETIFTEFIKLCDIICFDISCKLCLLFMCFVVAVLLLFLFFFSGSLGILTWFTGSQPRVFKFAERKKLHLTKQDFDASPSIPSFPHLLPPWPTSFPGVMRATPTWKGRLLILILFSGPHYSPWASLLLQSPFQGAGPFYS